MTKYNVEKYSTTVIRSEKEWSTTIKGPNGHCAVEPENMQGIENECIIYGRMQSCSNLEVLAYMHMYESSGPATISLEQEMDLLLSSIVMKNSQVSSSSFPFESDSILRKLTLLK